MNDPQSHPLPLDHNFRILLDAGLGSFILIALDYLDRPVSIDEIADLLSLKLLKAIELFMDLTRLGLVDLVDGDRYKVTSAGLALFDLQPGSSPASFFTVHPPLGKGNTGILLQDRKSTRRNGHKPS